jgi:hypothetical protein
MAGLADDWEENRQTCVDVLCAYLRMPYEPDPGQDAPEAQRLTFQAIREVRHTVIRVVAAHLREGAAVSWQGLNFDFTGAVFDGGSFSGAEFSGGNVTFADAEFSSGSVDFRGASFGGQVYFYGAKFSGGYVTFAGAKFSGGQVDFAAVFSGGHISFSAEFSGSTVSFGYALPAEIDYACAWFSGGEVDFGLARFSGGNVSFNGALFTGGTVDLSHAHWSVEPGFGWPPDSPPYGVKLPRPS